MDTYDIAKLVTPQGSERRLGIRYGTVVSVGPGNSLGLVPDGGMDEVPCVRCLQPLGGRPRDRGRQRYRVVGHGRCGRRWRRWRGRDFGKLLVLGHFGLEGRRNMGFRTLHACVGAYQRRANRRHVQGVMTNGIGILGLKRAATLQGAAGSFQRSDFRDNVLRDAAGWKRDGRGVPVQGEQGDGCGAFLRRAIARATCTTWRRQV